MSDSFAPTFKNSTGRIQQFGGEQTLTWDFTSALGNPMELVVGGSTVFTFSRTGALALESHVTWNTDASGNIGAQYDTRPDEIHVASSLAVGAVTGVGDGAQLLLNRLVLGHADVDKYIDAEQGLASTPFLRYNATHSRWEYSNDGIVVMTFGSLVGVTSWDDLYALDKTLTIDSTPLTWDQTSVTGSGFIVQRGLALGFTDAPVMVVQQTNVADDQPALAICQGTTAASALDIYEGDVATGTVRFAFDAYGRLNIVSSIAATTEMVRLEQTAPTQPFLEFVGTAAAGAGNSISTDANPTADMLMVQVNAATRWIPTYATSALPGAPSWDSIYAVDKDLDISTTTLLFTQTPTSTMGYGFEILRNNDSTDTSTAIVHIENQHAQDDQATILIEGTADSTVGVLSDKDVVDVVATSTGLAAAATLIGVKSVVNEDATDDATAALHSYYADVGGVHVAGVTHGYYATDSFMWGMKSASPVLIEVDTSSVLFTSPVGLVVSDLAGAGDTVPFIIMDGPAVGGTARLVVYRHGRVDINAENTTRALYVRQADATTGNQLILTLRDDNLGADRINVYQQGAITHELMDPTANFDAYTLSATSGGLVGPAALRGFVVDFTGNILDNAGGVYGVDLDFTDGGGTNDARAINITGDWTYGIVSASPWALDINSATTAFAVAQAGAGELVDLKTGTLAAGVSVWTISSIGAIEQTTDPDPTVSFTAYAITLTSGGMNNKKLRGISVDLTSHAGDLNDSPAYGIELVHSGGGGSVDSRAVEISGAWDLGISINTTVGGGTGIGITSPVGPIVQYTGAAGINWNLLADGGLHHTSTALNSIPAHYLQATSPTLADGNATYSLQILSQTAAPGHANARHYGVYLNNFDAGGGATIGTGIYVGTSYNYGLYSLSAAYIDSSATTVATIKATDATPTNILLLQDETPTTRLGFTRIGALAHTPPSKTASFDAHTLTLTSGGILGLAELVGQYINVAGHATDTGYVVGQKLEFTPNAGAAISMGVRITNDWLYGVASDSPVSITNPDALPMTAGMLLSISTSNADPVADNFVQFTDLNAGATRFQLDQLGVGEWDADAASDALTIGQSGAGDILALKDGTVLAGTTRYTFGLKGQLDIVSDAASATELLRLEQNDTDMPFVEFRGTAAAGEGSSISNDSSGVADMLQVEVDIVGVGLAKRWIPAYVSASLSTSNTLQETYEYGNTILTDAGNGILGFTTGGAAAIDFTLTDGNFNVTTSANGNVQFDNGANNYLLINGGTGATTLSAIANTLTLSTVTSGAVAIAPVTGNDITLTTLGAAGEITLASASTDVSGAIRVDASAGGVSLDAAAASNFTTSTGLLTLSGGSGVTITSTGGTLTLDGTGRTVNLNSAALNIDASATVSIDCAAGFDIALTVANHADGDLIFTAHGGTAVNFNDATYNDLDDFPAAYRTVCGALNYVLNSDGIINAIMAGEDLATGEVVGMENVAGVPKLYKADADHANNRKRPIGIVRTAALAGAYPEVYTGGRVLVHVEAGSGLETAANVGEEVYCTVDGDGYLSTTQPAVGLATRVGWLALAGTVGNVDGYIIIGIGPSVTI